MNFPKIQKKYRFGIVIIIAMFITGYLIGGDFGYLMRFIAIGVFLPGLIAIMIGNRGKRKIQESSTAKKTNA